MVHRAICSPQQLLGVVTEVVTEGIVYGFETVEIKTQKCKGFASALSLGEGVFETAVEQETVGEAGKRVVVGPVVEPLFLVFEKPPETHGKGTQ